MMTESITPRQIIVDARQCGDGKTDDRSPTATWDKGRILSIYSNLKDGWSVGQRYLVVLPSIALIEAYEQYIGEFLQQEEQEIFGGYTHPQLVAITSRRYDNVQQHLHEELNRYTPIILITHQAWLHSKINSIQRRHYNLVIDEAIMPYKEVAIYHSRDCNVDFRWHENTDCLACEDAAVEWPEIRFHDLLGSFITDATEQVRSLTNENYRNRVNIQDYDKFHGAIPKNKRISIIQELRPEIFDHWSSIWIACAAFEYTFMAAWMEQHNIAYRIHHRLPFRPHQVLLRIQGPDDLKFTWSSYKQTNEQELIDQYRDQVAPQAGDNPVLVLRNVDQRRQIFQQEQLLPHNSAGLNDFRNYEHISLESALNPSPTMTRFLRDVYGMGEDKSYDRVHMAQTVYLFYQTIMRSCLRDHKPATVYCLDNRVIMGLAEFFTDIEFNQIRLVRRTDLEEPGRPLSTDLGRALTSAERVFIAKKRRYAQYQQMTNDEILALRK